MHRFTRAVSVGNPREFLQAEKEDQEMAEACKRLIKNCTICWNYLYLSQKLEETKDAASREAFLDAVAHGSAISWQHINLLGEYDFSEEKLRDSVGIRLWLPKTPSALKTQRCRAFVRSWWYLDELSFRRPFHSGSLQFSNPCHPASGDPRASSPTHRSPKERAASVAPPALRPALVGRALAMVARLAP
jgi:hypothetical protein